MGLAIADDWNPVEFPFDDQLSWKAVEAYDHVVKRIKANQRICTNVLKIAFEGARNRWRRYSLHVLYPTIDVFANEPIEQWLEIFDFEMHVKPLWFTASRVYHLPIEVTAGTTGSRTDLLMFYCNIKKNQKHHTIVTFRLRCDRKVDAGSGPGGYPGGPTHEQLKQWLLMWQTQNAFFETAFTG